jgi:hypothetical protein
MKKLHILMPILSFVMLLFPGLSTMDSRLPDSSDRTSLRPY